MDHFIDVQAASRCNITTKISRNENTTISSNSVFDGHAYNSVSIGSYTEEDDEKFSKFPGLIAYASGFTTPEDFSSTVAFDTDQEIGPFATINLDTEDDYF